MAKLNPALRVLPIGAMVIAMVAFLGGASFAKGLFAAVGAEGASTLRLAFAAVILVAIWRPWRTPLEANARWATLGYGAAIGAMTLCFYMAIRTIPLGIAAAVQFTGPLAVAILSSRRATDLVWAACAAAGLLLLLPWSAASAPLDLVGMMYALGAGAGWGLYIIFGQKAGAVGPGRAVALGTMVAAVVVAPFGLAHAGFGLFNPAILPLALAVAVMTTVIPYSLEMYAMTRLPAATYGILSSLEPAVGVLAGFVLLGEHLTVPQMAAVGAVMMASAGTVLTHKEIDVSLV